MFIHTFHNPIIPGFAPDASTIYHDGHYFLVTSSFHLFPGLPIYTSQDLKTWSHLANAICRSSQLSLSTATSKLRKSVNGPTMVATSGLYAPTLRFRNNTFYIICTNVIDETTSDFQNFIITSKDIWSSDSWSDPVFFDWNGIDPSLYFSPDDGKVYVQGAWSLGFRHKPANTISQVEIDVTTGKHLSDVKVIWEGWSGVNSEGPHVYKKDGWFYLMIAEGGTFEGHGVTIARSRDIWGPYNSFESNPILGYGKAGDGGWGEDGVGHVGHAELFQGRGGEWWATCLGVRKVDDAGDYPLGRESFLMPVKWEEGGWPEIERPRLEFTRSLAWDQSDKEQIGSRADIKEAEFVHIRNPNLEDYDLRHLEKIILYTSKGTLGDATDTATYLGKRQRGIASTATVRLHLPENLAGKNAKAGLAFYKDPLQYAEFVYDSESGCLALIFRNKAADVEVSTFSPRLDSKETVYLKIQASALGYAFLYSLDEGTWCILGQVELKTLSYRDFTGPTMGLYATSSSHRLPIAFGDFRVK